MENSAKSSSPLHNIKLKQKWSNISHIEKETIQKLKEKEYSNLPSDKGTECCILEREIYRKAALENQNDPHILQDFLYDC